MHRNRLDKIRAELEGFRFSQMKESEAESLARRLGRSPRSGKHQVWQSDEFPWLRPFPIPTHSRDLSPRVKTSVLDCLEEDVLAWEQRLRDE